MQGQRCDKKSCPCRLHDICTQNFFRVQKSKRCPLCKTEWSGASYVGERAVTSLDKNSQTKKRGDPAPGREPRVGAQSDVVDDANDQQNHDREDQEEEEDEDEEEVDEDEEEGDEEDGEGDEEEDT